MTKPNNKVRFTFPLELFRGPMGLGLKVYRKVGDVGFVNIVECEIEQDLSGTSDRVKSYLITEDQAKKILGALELGKVGVGFSIDECKMSDQDESYIDEAIAIMTGGLDNEKT